MKTVFLSVMAVVLFLVSSCNRHAFKPKMVFVEGGTFIMGSTEYGARMDEKSAHQVTLSSFKISKYEITQGQWEAVMGTTITQQRHKSDPDWNVDLGEGNNYPMYWVNWYDVQEFIAKLNAITGKNYRLPTEAEWEYAARGGNKSKGYIYSGSNSIDDVAWWYGERNIIYTDKIPSRPQVVGSKFPNELGIYDMTGNMAEWCYDWYGDYPDSPQNNPQGPESGTFRVVRGGSWSHDAIDCRVTRRKRSRPDFRCTYHGFRVVLPAK